MTEKDIKDYLSKLSAADINRILIKSLTVEEYKKLINEVANTLIKLCSEK